LSSTHRLIHPIQTTCPRITPSRQEVVVVLVVTVVEIVVEVTVEVVVLRVVDCDE